MIQKYIFLQYEYNVCLKHRGGKTISDMHKHVPKIQGEKYNKDDSLRSRLTLESDLNFFDNIEKNERRNTKTSPLTFLSLYAIKTNILILISSFDCILGETPLF